MKTLPVILLDPRLGSGDLFGLLPRAHTELTRLDDADGRGIGDVMSSGFGPIGPILWGIEVKRLSDALQCLQDGRLAASQLVRMHDHFDYVFLLIEEDLRVAPDSGYLQKRVRKQHARTHRWQEYWVDAVYGASERVIAADFFEWLTSLHIGGGARLLRSGSREETAAWITAVWRFFAKPWDEHRSLKVFDDSQPPRFVIPSKAAKVARALADGVGWEKAMAVGEHFGTPEALINASEAALEAVDGIGTELAARLHAGARERHAHVEKRGGRLRAGVSARKRQREATKSAEAAAAAAAIVDTGSGTEETNGRTRAHGNVLSSPHHRPAAKRRAHPVPLPRSNTQSLGRRDGRRTAKED